MSEDQKECQEAFERWCKKDKITHSLSKLPKPEDGRIYINSDTHFEYQAWKAGRLSGKRYRKGKNP